MRVALAAAILPVLAAAGPAQEGQFASADYGVRLKIPAGWNVDATRMAQVVLKLTLPGEHPFPPEIIVSELLFPEEHITIGQYREQIRQYIQRTYRDPRLLDDRSVTVGGRPGFVFTTASKAKSDAAAHSFKGLIEISPMRLLSVECVVPQKMEEAAARTFDAVLQTIEFIPRKTPEGTAEGLKRFAEAAAKLPATEATLDRKHELEYVLGERKIGLYEQTLKAATRDGAAGIESSTVDVIDLGQDGRLEKRTTAFLSDDLAKQRAEIEVIHRGKEQRVQYFTASVALDGAQATIARRINGEKSSVTVKVPERTVLFELLETVVYRMAAGEKQQVSIPVLLAFDNDPGTVKVENAGVSEMRSPGGGMSKVQVFYVGREDAPLITYWFEADRKILRRSVGGQSVVLQAKK